MNKAKSILPKAFSFEKTHITSHQMLRFLITGSITQAIALGVLYILTEEAGLYYLFSEALGFLLAIVFSYFLCIKWVFAKRAIRNKKLEFALFVLIGIGGLILEAFFILLLTEEFSIYYINSKLISLIIIYFYSFFVRKILLFN